MRSATTRWTLATLSALGLLTPLGLSARPGTDDPATPCEKTAAALRNAAFLSARDDFWIGIAGCLNLENRADAARCFQENASAFLGRLVTASTQFEAREDLCDLLGGVRHDPRIDPAHFVSGVTNPLFPLVPGRTMVYQKVSAEGVERVEQTVTPDTRVILGVTCMVMHFVSTLDDELIEDTLDYFAQDDTGNVWYFGELALNYEDGELRDIAGSWRAGMDGAKPGIVMKSVSAVGDTYRQEFLVGEAEDAARVTGVGRIVTVPFGTFHGCLETIEFTPIEPNKFEAKSFAPGLGQVLSVNLTTGEREELIAVF